MLIAPIHLEASEQQPVGGCAAVEAHQDHLCAHQAARMLFPLTINNRLETLKMIMISCLIRIKIILQAKEQHRKRSTQDFSV